MRTGPGSCIGSARPLLKTAPSKLFCNIVGGAFAVSVPYHPAKQGLLCAIPVRFDKEEYTVPQSDMTFYTVEDTVKLSIHMDGFVQFSSGGRQPIISGYNQGLQ